MLIVPDTVSESVEKALNEITTCYDMNALRLKAISVYWLYLSVHYLVCLPQEAFFTLNEQKRQEMKRIKDILMIVLKAISGSQTAAAGDSNGIYRGYIDRWNKIVTQRN